MALLHLSFSAAILIIDNLVAVSVLDSLAVDLLLMSWQAESSLNLLSEAPTLLQLHLLDSQVGRLLKYQVIDLEAE